MELKDNDTLVAHLENGELKLHGSRVGLRKAQAVLRRYVPEGVSLADELIERHVFAWLQDVEAGRVDGLGALLHRLRAGWSVRPLTSANRQSELYRRLHACDLDEHLALRQAAKAAGQFWGCRCNACELEFQREELARYAEFAGEGSGEYVA